MLSKKFENGIEVDDVSNVVPGWHENKPEYYVRVYDGRNYDEYKVYKTDIVGFSFITPEDRVKDTCTKIFWEDVYKNKIRSGIKIKLISDPSDVYFKVYAICIKKSFVKDASIPYTRPVKNKRGGVIYNGY